MLTKIPNELTQKVFEETDRGENLITHSTVRDIFEELEKEIEVESKDVTSR